MTVVKLEKAQSNWKPCSGLPLISETTSCWYSGTAKKTISHSRPGPRNSHGMRALRRCSDSRSTASGPGHLRHRLLHLPLVAGRQGRVRVQLGGHVGGREDQRVLGQLLVRLREDLLDALDRRDVVHVG